MIRMYAQKEVSGDVAAGVIDTVREQLSGLAWVCYKGDSAAIITGAGSELVRREWECADARPEGKSDPKLGLGPAVVRLEPYGERYILSVFDYSDRTDDNLAGSLEPGGVPLFREAISKAKHLFKDLPEACGRDFPERSDEDEDLP
ncbi:hypothetical protein KY360_04140 [Candidatus Woesearchaeota archaeon]|nr:hypothetical protein [Candidatus Woesearchaeota archaeon]